MGSEREERRKREEGRWETGRARVVSKPGFHRCRTGGEREGREEKERGPDGRRTRAGSFQTGLPPVQDRWGAREKSGEREGQRGDARARGSLQTGLPPVQVRWGAGGKREVAAFRAELNASPGLAGGIQGDRSWNGNGYAKNFGIRQECDNLNTPLPTPSRDSSTKHPADPHSFASVSGGAGRAQITSCQS